MNSAGGVGGTDLHGKTGRMNSLEAEIRHLKRTSHFGELSHEDLMALAARLQKKTYPANTFIFREGAPADLVLVIKEGEVEIRKKMQSTDGEQTLTVLREGGCFCETPLLTRRPACAVTAVATSATEAYILEKKDIQDLMKESMSISISLGRLANRPIEAGKPNGAPMETVSASRQASSLETELKKTADLLSLQDLDLQTDLLALIPRRVIMEHKMLPIALSNHRLTLAMVNPRNLLAFDEVKKYIKGAAIDTVLMTEDDFEMFMKNTYPKLMLLPESESKGVTPSHAQPKGKSPFASKDSMGGKDPFRSKDPLAMKDPFANKDPLMGKDSFGTKDTSGMMDPSLDLMKDIELIEERDDGSGITELEKEAGNAPIIRLANNIIALALKREASDIHLEPGEKGLRVRYRVDGMLRVEQVLPKKVLLPLVSRFKIISRLDITERRVPQDGRISLKVAGRTIDFRVSTIPSKYGEKIVVRILDKEAQVFGLDRLITNQSILALMRQMIKKPYGIIYVTGPTGSGKTTTLYSALAELNKPDVNISTVEDPIEYDLAGVNQVQVNPDIGLDFARVLRAFLRQDPDIILVGETRDRETAKIAVEAALTGHLVFTTLHTNDAPSTFIRLTEMGIEPFLISTSIIGIVAQRLVRKICPKCREAYELDEEAGRYLGLGAGTTVYRGTGCDACNQSGYKGRVGVYEVLLANEELRHMIAHGTSAEQIREKAIKSGMITLKDYALMLLRDGATSVDEVLRTVTIEV
ncbi:MAG: Type II secretion system protein E [Syntrophorhabdaceae bacterium PtaU1.Bin034]|nr:MAG: Type II secretion system protein E [Syntrophorhabdaceae bacterium PtaU1.Bin034]